MKPFMDKDFLLDTEAAKVLYHEYAEKMPIIDYHCHIDPMEIAEDVHWDNITQVWLGGRTPSGGYFGDHYKWRLMRSAGVPEKYITGDADPEDKFVAWAGALQGAIGNPLYHWTHLELQRYFDIHAPLTRENASQVYQACNRRLQEGDLSVRGILRQSRVKLLCTTDDPADDLKAHERIAADKNCPTIVLPAFRPDKAMRVDKPAFAPYIRRLEQVVGFSINTMEDLRRALLARIDYFEAHGCRVSDHALDGMFCVHAAESALNETLQKGKRGEAVSEEAYKAFHTDLLLTCARAYAQKGWVMQLHFGCIRDNSSKMFARLGPDTGFDAMNDVSNARGLAALLDLLEKENALPRTVLYSLNPADNGIIGTVMGAFQTDSDIPGRIQLGSAWWFNDHRSGMEQQLRDLMDLGNLSSFVGMLTDSRSFLSYTRHEYFRRILCGMLGRMAENGEYPWDERYLGHMVEDISYRNARRYFRFDEFID